MGSILNYFKQVISEYLCSSPMEQVSFWAVLITIFEAVIILFFWFKNKKLSKEKKAITLVYQINLYLCEVHCDEVENRKEKLASLKAELDRLSILKDEVESRKEKLASLKAELDRLSILRDEVESRKEKLASLKAKVDELSTLINKDKHIKRFLESNKLYNDLLDRINKVEFKLKDEAGILEGFVKTGSYAKSFVTRVFLYKDMLWSLGKLSSIRFGEETHFSLFKWFNKSNYLKILYFGLFLVVSAGLYYWAYNSSTFIGIFDKIFDDLGL